jgi:hypothetical protein
MGKKYASRNTKTQKNRARLHLRPRPFCPALEFLRSGHPNSHTHTKNERYLHTHTHIHVIVCSPRQLLSQRKRETQNRLCFIVAGNTDAIKQLAEILNNSEKQTSEKFGEPARLCNSSFESHSPCNF